MCVCICTVILCISGAVSQQCARVLLSCDGGSVETAAAITVVLGRARGIPCGSEWVIEFDS